MTVMPWQNFSHNLQCSLYIIKLIEYVRVDVYKPYKFKITSWIILCF
jgi:hypothetical protein